MSKKEIDYPVDATIRFVLAYEDLLTKFGLEFDESYAKHFELQQKMEYLKREYPEYFIDTIIRDIKYYDVSIDRVFEVLPSKSFIEYSEEKARMAEQSEWFWYKSALDLVLRRLISSEIEEKYQKTPLDKKIFLGYSEYGPTVYTSFTKGEYEEDLEKTKKLIRKK